MALSKNIKTALQIVALPWLIYFVDVLLPIDLRAYGIQPRTKEGLWGILLAPLLHGGLHHIVANTGALFVLSIVSLSYSRRLTCRALLIILIGGGGLVWLFGQGPSLHIGSSGIIFGLIGYLIFLGIYRREWKALTVSVFIALLYGGTLLSLLVRTPGISWSGHFFGFITGVFAAAWMKNGNAK
jgi:membrane associated rhomboid family serine protease